MKNLKRWTAALACSMLSAALFSAAAQTSTEPPPASTSPSTPVSNAGAFAQDRLFLESFEFDGAIIPGQWWEANLTYTDADSVDAWTVDLLVALQMLAKLEVGGRVGFGSTDASGGLSDGTGATDLDFWGKWRVGTSSVDTDISVGAEVTVPTGDDAVGLGTDAFALTFFGALRQQMQNSVLTAYAGLQFNDDGQTFGTTLQGETAGIMGVGLMLPLTDTITFVGEGNLVTERFEGADSDFAVRGGINWHPTDKGVVRAALEFGLTDGAPDAVLLAGYAHTF